MVFEAFTEIVNVLQIVIIILILRELLGIGYPKKEGTIISDIPDKVQNWWKERKGKREEEEKKEEEIGKKLGELIPEGENEINRIVDGATKLEQYSLSPEFINVLEEVQSKILSPMLNDTSKLKQITEANFELIEKEIANIKKINTEINNLKIPKIKSKEVTELKNEIDKTKEILAKFIMDDAQLKNSKNNILQIINTLDNSIKNLSNSVSNLKNNKKDPMKRGLYSEEVKKNAKNTKIIATSLKQEYDSKMLSEIPKIGEHIKKIKINIKQIQEKLNVKQ